MKASLQPGAVVLYTRSKGFHHDVSDLFGPDITKCGVEVIELGGYSFFVREKVVLVVLLPFHME